MRKSVYQARVATTKIEQMMYKSTSVSVFDPESRLSWNEVCPLISSAPSDLPPYSRR